MTKEDKLKENQENLKKLEKNLAETSTIIAETVDRLRDKQDGLAEEADREALEKYCAELEKFVEQAKTMKDQLKQDIEEKRVKKFDPTLRRIEPVSVGKEIALLNRAIVVAGDVLSTTDPDEKVIAIEKLSKVKKDIQSHRGRDWHGIARTLTIIVGGAIIGALTFPLSAAAVIAYGFLSKKIEQPSAFRFHSLVSKFSKQTKQMERMGLFEKLTKTRKETGMVDKPKHKKSKK